MYVTNASFKNYMNRIVVEKNNYKFKGRAILLYWMTKKYGFSICFFDMFEHLLLDGSITIKLNGELQKAISDKIVNVLSYQTK